MILYRCCKEKFCLDQSQELKGWAVYFDLSFVLFHCRFYLSFSKNGGTCWRWFNQFWSCDFPNSIREFCWQWMGFFSWGCQEGRSKKGRLHFATDQWTSFTPVSLKYHICILFFGEGTDWLWFCFISYRGKILKIEPTFSQGSHFGGLTGENFCMKCYCSCDQII